MSMWLILWWMIFWRKWNDKLAKSVMNLIITVGINMKCMMTIYLCLIYLNKIVEIKYTYGFLNQPMAQNKLCRVTILFICHRMGGRNRLFR